MVSILLILTSIVAIVILALAYRRTQELSDRVDFLQREIDILRGKISRLQTPTEPHAEAPQASQAPVITGPIPPPSEPPKPRPTPPPFPSNAPPVIPEPSTAPIEPPPIFSRDVTTINWERFMGVNLFAWIGGFVLFLATAFFVKYSIDNNLISPEIRIALGSLLGIALLIGGLRLSIKQYRVTAQTLCSTGILILYADIFASYSFYHFLEVTAAFLLMIVVTAIAFFLAVRLDAKVVAVLGLLGGFFTPLLLSTGQDNPLGLFSYIFILDAGLIAIALRKKWTFLIPLAAVGTILLQLGWVSQFFTIGKIWAAWNIFAVFEFLFVIAFVFAKRLQQIDSWINASVLSISFWTISFAFYLLGFSNLGARPGTIFSFCILAEVGLIIAVLIRPAHHLAHRIAGLLIFLLLAIWTLFFLTEPLLNWALGVPLAFAIAHSIFPFIVQRINPADTSSRWVHLFPALSMLLLLIPIFKLTELSVAIWFVILFVDLIAVVIAVMTASVLSLIGVLLLTLFGMAGWIFKPSIASFELTEGLLVIAGFTVFFFIAGIFAGRKTKTPADQLAHIPALSSVLPFMLLMLMIIRLPLTNPSPIFAVALLLVFLILGLWRWLQIDLLTLIALLCCLGLEYTWHTFHFIPHRAVITTLLWYSLFFTIFTLLPFPFSNQLRNRLIPWGVSALSGPLHFYLFYNAINASYPNSYMGILPAMFSIPPLLSLIQRLRSVSKDETTRNSQLALFGGAALFFITLIFPIQFERQWITIGWALEGAALLWLYHRVPHQGLRWVGCVLLAIAFARLTLNPDIFNYYERSTIPMVNWYLYTYGIVTVCLFAAGWLESKIAGTNMRPWLYSFGTILAFVLVNIEIADYFSQGKTLNFQFSGNFARDMTYSIAWAIFAFILLIVGINRKLKAPRYAAIGLIGMTLGKLFLHDLINLGQLYRVGALLAVASVLIIASYLYQRFGSFETTETNR
jgi:uncharacterized membrane protein